MFCRPLNAANTQTCNYAHDDLARIAKVDCGASVWQQNFSYDNNAYSAGVRAGPFGNVIKTVPTGGTGGSFQPTYDLTKNRISTLPGNFTVQYDANGNVTNDSFHQYTWDVNGRPLTIDSIGLTFDALDRMVEQTIGSSHQQIVYSPTGGKLALMYAQTLVKAFVSLPGGGAAAIYNSSGLAYYC